jgi:hypothetical protein
MKMYWGVEVYLHAFLTSALDESEWSASHPGQTTWKIILKWILKKYGMKLWTGFI